MPTIAVIIVTATTPAIIKAIRALYTFEANLAGLNTSRISIGPMSAAKRFDSFEPILQELLVGISSSCAASFTPPVVNLAKFEPVPEEKTRRDIP